MKTIAITKTLVVDTITGDVSGIDETRVDNVILYSRHPSVDGHAQMDTLVTKAEADGWEKAGSRIMETSNKEVGARLVPALIITQEMKKVVPEYKPCSNWDGKPKFSLENAKRIDAALQKGIINPESIPVDPDFIGPIKPKFDQDLLSQQMRDITNATIRNMVLIDEENPDNDQ